MGCGASTKRKDEVKAATKIQAQFRGNQSRKKYAAAETQETTYLERRDSASAPRNSENFAMLRSSTTMSPKSPSLKKHLHIQEGHRVSSFRQAHKILDAYPQTMHRQKTLVQHEREDKFHQKKYDRKVSEAPKKLMCKSCAVFLLDLRQEATFYYCKRCWEGSGCTMMYHVCENCYREARDAEVRLAPAKTTGVSAALGYDVITLGDEVIADRPSLHGLPSLPNSANEDADDADTQTVRPRSYSEDFSGTVGEMDARSRRRAQRELQRRESSQGSGVPGHLLSSRRTMPELSLLELNPAEDNAWAARSSRSDDGPSRPAFDVNGKQHSARLGTYASYRVQGGLSPIPASPMVDDAGIFFDPTRPAAGPLDRAAQERSYDRLLEELQQPMQVEPGQMAAQHEQMQIA